jgi:hypothetical protein
VHRRPQSAISRRRLDGSMEIPVRAAKSLVVGAAAR